MDDATLPMGLSGPCQSGEVAAHSWNMKTLTLALVLLSAAFLHAQSAPSQNTTGQGGQQQQGDEATKDGIWDGRFKGGNYLVRCNSIIGLSKHEYVADGVARVVEVNLTLGSSQIVRFYFLEPAKPETGSTAAEAAMNALDRAKNMVEQATSRISPTLTEPKVVKTYPASTHAHTVEFVLKEEARLNSLFQSLERGFRTGQGRIWRE